MKKKISNGAILSAVILICITIYARNNVPKIESDDCIIEESACEITSYYDKLDEEQENLQEIYIMSIDSNVINIEPEDEISIKSDEMREELDKISSIDNNEKWFKKYKKIQEKYLEYFDPDETIYDVFSDDELELLFQIVEAEVTGDDYFDSKANVASVIFNRLNSEEFPDDITEVLKQKVGRYGQFSTYWNGRYKNVEVTKTTILACEYSFQIEDTTDGCLYFDSCEGDSWNNRNREFIFRDEVGHDFFK